MSLKLRRFLYIFFILIFLIITPLICLYAAGYKLDNGLTIKKTGMLIINSEPPGAKIFLNNQPQQLFLNKLLKNSNKIIKSPAKIKNLLPGEYTVRLELENYWPWQKKLKILSGKSTFAEDIILFKKDLPVLLEPGEFNYASFSNLFKYAAFADKQTVNLLNLNNGAKKQFLISTNTKNNFSSLDSKFVWSPKNTAVIINKLLFDTDEWDKPIELQKVLGKNFFNTTWGQEKNEIYFASDKNLLSLDLDDYKIETIVSKTAFSDYLIKNNFVFLVETNNQKSAVSVWDIEKQELLSKVSLPFSNYKFIHSISNLINLYDEKYHILYLLDPFSPMKQLKDAITNANLSYWADENKLLYSNGFEIWLYNLDNNKKTLLTRISKEITGLFMYSSDNYVIFTTNSSINVIELDDREKRNITKIFDFDELKWPQINKEGNILFFYGQIGNQKGIYKLAI
ncbi:MAG: hypothetical protein U9R06_03380 [Patescibacteria group bacterium]|nr:hypothetical protein [Patescibacteria group bacterium]